MSGKSCLKVILTEPGLSLHDLSALISAIVSHEPRVSTQIMGAVNAGLGVGRLAADPGNAATDNPPASTIATAAPLRDKRSSEGIQELYQHQRGLQNKAA
jgi:hypothetical protein